MCAGSAGARSSHLKSRAPSHCRPPPRCAPLHCPVSLPESFLIILRRMAEPRGDAGALSLAASASPAACSPEDAQCDGAQDESWDHSAQAVAPDFSLFVRVKSGVSNTGVVDGTRSERQSRGHKSPLCFALRPDPASMDEDFYSDSEADRRTQRLARRGQRLLLLGARDSAARRSGPRCSASQTPGPASLWLTLIWPPSATCGAYI